MNYSRMTVKVALVCIDPEVAVTVAVEVTGGFVELPDVPPQAETRLSPANRSTSGISKCSRLRFLKPRKQSATARVAGNIGLKSWPTAAADAGGVTVSVVVPVAFWAIVSGLGLKVQV